MFTKHGESDSYFSKESPQNIRVNLYKQDPSYIRFNQQLHHKNHLSLIQSKNESYESPSKNATQSVSTSKNGTYPNQRAINVTPPGREKEKSLSQEGHQSKSHDMTQTISQVATNFTVATLQQAQDQLITLQQQINQLVKPAGAQPKSFDLSFKVMPTKSLLQNKNKQKKDIPQKLKLILQHVNQFIANIQELEVKENEVIKNLQYENSILEKQILMLLKEKGGTQERLKIIEDTQKRVLLEHQFKDVSKLKVIFKKQRIQITESQEESEIYKLSGELLSYQLENLQKQINLLMKENLKLKEINRQEQEKFIIQVEQQTGLRQVIMEVEKEKQNLQEQVKSQIIQLEQFKDKCVQNNQKPKPTIIVSQPDIPRIDKAQHLQIVKQLESEMIEFKIEASKHEKQTGMLRGENSLLKSSVTRLQQEKVTVQKSLIEQIQSLQTEKDQIADQYITQINDLTRRLSQLEEDHNQINELKSINTKLWQDLSSLQQELDSYRKLEAEMSHRKQSSLQKDQQQKKYLQEINKLKDELKSANSQIDSRVSEVQKYNQTIKTLELQRDQMVYEVSESQRQLQEKCKQETEKQVETIFKDQENLLQEEIEKIYQQNKSKMIQMKSKLLGLKTNIEKHGEQMGVQARQHGQSTKTPQEIAHEAQFQFQLVMEELYKLIDQMNDLQKAIDVDYGNKFTKINEKQRVLTAQNFQLKQEVKKIESLEESNKEKDKQMEQFKENLRLVTIEYKEYKDIMRTKFSDLNRGSSKTLEISEEDKNETSRQKQIEKLKQTAKELETKNQMLKVDLSAAQQQIQQMAQMQSAQMTVQTLPPELLQQMMFQQQDEGMVRSAARTIQQNSLDLKQSDILNKKINDLSEKLSHKTLESQKRLSEYASLKDSLKQEKLEWVSQLGKRDKQYKILEEKYKKSLEQFEELQQKYFTLEHANNGLKHSSGSDSD